MIRPVIQGKQAPAERRAGPPSSISPSVTAPVYLAGMRRSYATLDAIRGVGAVMIVVRHTGAYFGAFQPPESFLAVDLFFVLSGFVLTHAYQDRLEGEMTALDFLRVRLVRFAPLYWLGLLGGTLAAALAILIGRGDMSWLGIGVSFLTGLVFLPSPMPGATGWKLFPLNDPSWSLFFELIANLALAVYWRRLSNRNLAMVCLVAGGVLAMSVLNLGYAAEGFRWPGMLMGLLRVFYSFFAGVLIYRFRDRIRMGVHPLIALLLVAAALLGAPPDRWRAIYDLAWILVGFPAIIALASAREPAAAGAGAFRFLGVTSYGVYVLHYPLQRLIMIAATALGIDIGAFAPWGGLIFVAGVTALCWRLDSVYDQPMRRRLNERLRGWLKPVPAPALPSASSP